MPKSVQVTRITVEYQAQGKTHVVEFDPGKVQSIVFDDRFKTNAILKKVAGQGTKSTDGFLAGDGIPAVVEGHATHARPATTALSTESTGSLWWVSDKGVWFHPQDES